MKKRTNRAYAFLRAMFLTGMGMLHIDVLRILGDHGRRRIWRKAAQNGARRDDGLCIVADLLKIKSLSQVARDFIGKIRQTSIPFDVIDMGDPGGQSRDLSENEAAPYRELSRERTDFRKTVIFAAGRIVKDSHFNNYTTPFWEFESGLPEVMPEIFDDTTGLMVFSDFCQKYFASIAPRGMLVHKVRYPLPDDWTARCSRGQVRQRNGIPDDAFVVFFHFDFRSGYDRKNPQGVLEAFVRAFPDDPGVRLVVKTGGADWDLRNGVKFKSLIREMKLEDRMVLIDASMAHQDILDLISASDVYMSLHRGEGFGIGMLEAMSVGTPVVATNYGGNTDFTKPETAFMVDYKMVKPETTFGLYQHVREWPEPSVRQASAYLLQLRKDPLVGANRARAAKTFIKDYFSLANFERDVRDFLAKTSA